MEIVNLRNWYSTQQVKDLLGFKYHTQVHRWRKANQITHLHLCNHAFYLRASVNLFMTQQPQVYRYSVRRLDKGVQRRYNYEKLVELYERIMAVPAYNIALDVWQPYCMLVAEPHRMILSRLSSQVVVPQVRTKTAYGIKFYNVEDIEREFK